MKIYLIQHYYLCFWSCILIEVSILTQALLHIDQLSFQRMVVICMAHLCQLPDSCNCVYHQNRSFLTIMERSTDLSNTDSIITLTYEDRKRRGDGWYKLKVGLRGQITNHYGGLFKKKGNIISLTKKRRWLNLRTQGGELLK